CGSVVRRRRQAFTSAIVAGLAYQFFLRADYRFGKRTGGTAQGHEGQGVGSNGRSADGLSCRRVIAMPAAPRIPGDWHSVETNTPIEYRCGYCDAMVGTRAGYYLSQHPLVFRIRICPNCNRPTFFEHDTQTPAVAFGEHVGNLPEQ